MRWLAIINPHSGRNRNRARLAEVVAGLQPMVDKTVFTRCPGEATEFAMKAQAYSGVATVGGDGTLFEILQGINRQQQRVAVIPAGRGNTLARDLDLVRRHSLFDAIHWEKARLIDLLEVNVTAADGKESIHLSASTIALGYPAAVSLGARQLAWLGGMSYAAAAAVARPAHFGVRAQYDGGMARDTRLSGFIANNTRHLANFVAFHEGNCSDGLFEIMEMSAGRVKQTAHNLSAFSGTRVYQPYPPTQARSARLQLETPQNLMIDGEIIPDVVSLDIRILPSALACNGPISR
jgi:diacylglycerol kinase family enzyme